MYSLDWPYLNGIPKSTASFKLTPEDFQVNEFFDEPFSGDGEHMVVKIEKRGLTTEAVVKALARMINKPEKSISYAGLKDRQGVTTQWLSIHVPGEHIAGLEAVEGQGFRVLEVSRHHKKLRPGFLAGNRFIIRLHDITDKNDLLMRIERLRSQGVPNYFGEQRFGREGGNLIKAQEMLVQGRKVKDRFLKGMYCSAARSWLFNLILSQRVMDSTWNVPLIGDRMQLSGSNSIFAIDVVDDELIKRVQERDISPASPLPGKSKRKIDVISLINALYSEWQPWIDGLERLGLEEAWRANILHVTELEYVIKNNSVHLSFSLPPGAYATTVLRELVLY